MLYHHLPDTIKISGTCGEEEEEGKNTGIFLLETFSNLKIKPL
jgi:hypothetical protein